MSDKGRRRRYTALGRGAASKRGQLF